MALREKIPRARERMATPAVAQSEVSLLLISYSRPRLFYSEPQFLSELRTKTKIPITCVDLY